MSNSISCSCRVLFVTIRISLINASFNVLFCSVLSFVFGNAKGLYVNQWKPLIKQYVPVARLHNMLQMQNCWYFRHGFCLYAFLRLIIQMTHCPGKFFLSEIYTATKSIRWTMFCFCAFDI